MPLQLIVKNAQLLGTKPGSFTSTEGNNKGQTYQWTELEFHSRETGTFVLKTVAPVQVADDLMGRPLDWTLDVLPKINGNKPVTFKVSAINASKPKA